MRPPTISPPLQMALSILYYTISTKNPRKTSQVMQNPDAARQGFYKLLPLFQLLQRGPGGGLLRLLFAVAGAKTHRLTIQCYRHGEYLGVVGAAL